jgi:hypothetical protein
MGKYYAILPQVPSFNVKEYVAHFKAQAVEVGFEYSSGKNTDWVDAEAIRKLIKEHIDPDFTI